MPRTAPSEERQDLHNSAVDEHVALNGACGEVHLQTGRTCILESGHAGSCDFVPQDEVAKSLGVDKPS
jgi:predicted anti-sigma-YlaC factor YlaD